MSGPSLSDLPIARSWFRFETLDEGIVRISEPHVHELIQANSYLVKGRTYDLLIDSGLGIARLRPALEKARFLDKRIVAVATHSHYDHIGSMHEFDERLIHAAEADEMAQASDDGTLWSTDFPESFRRSSADLGMPLPDLLITALPSQGYDPSDYRLRPAPATGLLAEGDTLDLGNLRFDVLHLPGHSPGGIGLLDPKTGVLFSGDAIYDGPLLDEDLPGADILAYIETMRRLRALKPTVVHGGHYESFGTPKLVELADEYLTRRDGASH